jgi:hypothetical protein
MTQEEFDKAKKLIQFGWSKTAGMVSSDGYLLLDRFLNEVRAWCVDNVREPKTAVDEALEAHDDFDWNKADEEE